MEDSYARLRKMLSQRLESLARAGVTHLPRAAAAGPLPAMSPTETASEDKPPRSAAPPATPPDAGAASASPVADLSSKAKEVDAADKAATPSSKPSDSQRARLSRSLLEDAPSAAPPPKDRPAALRVLAAEVADCTRCEELARTRTQTVFGVGNPNARVVFMGEAPGGDEDRQGEPFVGKAGRLLTKMIENGMGLRREDVYILNTIKCRPPENRNPHPEEAANCRGFLDRQLDILAPEYIVCLGAVAARNLLKTTQSVGKLRGRFHDYGGIKVVVSYHPAYLLRNPPDKRKAWEDLKMLMTDMGLPIPQKGAGG